MQKILTKIKVTEVLPQAALSIHNSSYVNMKWWGANVKEFGLAWLIASGALLLVRVDYQFTPHIQVEVRSGPISVNQLDAYLFGHSLISILTRERF